MPQGDVMALVAANLIMAEGMREIKQCAAISYVDDLMILSSERQELQRVCAAFLAWLTKTRASRQC